MAAENEQASKTLKVRGNCRNGGRRWNLFKPGAEKLQISRVRSCVELCLCLPQGWDLPALGFVFITTCLTNSFLNP